MNIKPTTIAYHRNGIDGAPFNVMLFHDGDSEKMAIVFERPGYCAVLDVTKLAAGGIAFGSNSWRGDCYEPALRPAIDKFNEG
jgi:hypothetical protein